MSKMLLCAGPIAWDCISNKIKTLALHVFSYQVKLRLFVVY